MMLLVARIHNKVNYSICQLQNILTNYIICMYIKILLIINLSTYKINLLIIIFHKKKHFQITYQAMSMTGFFLIWVLAFVARPIYAAQHVVGDSSGWTLFSDYQRTWVPSNTFYVGDTL